MKEIGAREKISLARKMFRVLGTEMGFHRSFGPKKESVHPNLTANDGSWMEAEAAIFDAERKRAEAYLFISRQRPR